MTEKNAQTAIAGTMEIKEAKKTYTLASPKAQELPKASVGEFIGDVKSEFKKINWTSWDELKVYTKVVVAATFFFGIGIYIVDLLIQGVLGALSAIIQWIA